MQALRRMTRRMGLFWAMMVACGTLTMGCVYLAVGELGQSWGGFFFSSCPTVVNGYNTDLVYFDYVLAVNGTPVQSGPELRAIVQRTPPGELLTYRIARGAQ